MKKLLVIFSLFMLLATAVLGVDALNPTVTNETTMGTIYTTWECVSAEDDIYCFMPEQDQDGMYKYEVSTETLSLVTSLPFDSSFGGNLFECEYYSPYIYCLGSDSNPNVESHFKIQLDGTGFAYLSNYIDRVDQDELGCSLRPGTDEVWCWAAYSNKSTLLKYDTGSDAWTIVSRDVFYSFGINAYDVACSFRDSNELWCAGGYWASGDSRSNETMTYFIDTNTSVTHYMEYDDVSGTCRWFDDIFYCYTGDDYNYPSNVISYYDPSDTSTGELDPFPVKLANYQGCAEVDEYTDYCLGGYINDAWDYDDTVWKLLWGEPPAEPEDGGTVTENTTYDPGNYSIPNNYTVAGDDIVLDFSGSTVSNGSIVVTGDNVVITGLVTEEALVVTGSNVDYTDVERVGISFEEFRISNDSTDLIVEVDLTDVDLVLEEADGKIDFDTNVDLSVNGELDTYVDIGINSITIDSVSAPNLDVSARITFYDTGYNTPEEVLIYKNGELCTADCTLVSVDNGVVVADVTGFSTYLLVGVGLDISQENFLTLRSNMIYILSAFALVVVLIAAMFIALVATGGDLPWMEITVVVLVLAAGFASLIAVFVIIMNNFVVV